MLLIIFFAHVCICKIMQGIRRKRCGHCMGCLHTDCGQCLFCKDKPKFGGQGRLKQCCKKRKCLGLTQLSTFSQPDTTSQPPQPKRMCTNTDLNTPILNLSSFLQTSGRKKHPVIGDGNCFFRAISFHLLEDEEHHGIIRSLIQRFENLNQPLFEQRLINGVNKPTMMEHIRHLCYPSTWATHIEAMATATMFQVPVYYCKFHCNGYRWEIFHPLKPADQIRLPVMPEEEPYTSLVAHHFELAYVDGCHYDCIVSDITGKVCQSFPPLTGCTYHIDLS